MRKLFWAVSLCALVLSCGRKYHGYANDYRFSYPVGAPDYSRLDYWAAHPWKHDPSDSMPKPLRRQRQDSLADVFFIHPTTYTDKKEGWNAAINDAELNAKTDYSTILFQASVFNQHCRIFAPRYRQAHISAFYTKSEEAVAAFDTAYSDVRNAFEVYLKEYHHDRPIIIAGHSQGAKLALRLLKEFFDGKPLKEKLVAAYIVGWSIPANSFQQIPVCKDSLQTGCYCGWRTFEKGYTAFYIEGEPANVFVTNPLSWTTTDTYAGAELNKGSVLRNFNQVLPHTTDAQVANTILWSTKPKFPGAVFYRSKNYHIADINLFYVNIRENVEQRIFAYLKAH